MGRKAKRGAGKRTEREGGGGEGAMWGKGWKCDRAEIATGKRARVTSSTAPPMRVHMDGTTPKPTNTQTGPKMVSPSSTSATCGRRKGVQKRNGAGGGEMWREGEVYGSRRRGWCREGEVQGRRRGGAGRRRGVAWQKMGRCRAEGRGEGQMEER